MSRRHTQVFRTYRLALSPKGSLRGPHSRSEFSASTPPLVDGPKRYEGQLRAGLTQVNAGGPSAAIDNFCEAKAFSFD
jgi:hypothetical protein